MKLVGDNDGIEELKYIKESNLFYLKYLIKEAETSLNRTAEFKGRDGKQKFKISYNPQTWSTLYTALSSIPQICKGQSLWDLFCTSHGCLWR
jgi:hypothetical protein